MPGSANRKRNAARRRALELLASCRDGCTEAVMLAHGHGSADGRACARRARDGDGGARGCGLRKQEGGHSKERTQAERACWPRSSGDRARHR